MILQILSLFSSEKKSKLFFQRLRWQGNRSCPHCGNQNLWRSPHSRFRCKSCRYPFEEFTGTYLGRFRIPLNIVSHLIYLFALGVPAYRVSKYVSCDTTTVEKVFRTLREAIYDLSFEDFISRRIRGELECPDLLELKAKELENLYRGGKLGIDDTMFVAGPRGKRAWGAYGKNIVFGIYHKDGKVVVFPVPDRNKEILFPLILNHNQSGEVYYANKNQGYMSLVFEGKHYGTRNLGGSNEGSKNKDGKDFWSYTKSWLSVYHGIPRKYFHLYLKEIEFRFNYREEDLFILFAQLITKLVPKRGVLPHRINMTDKTKSADLRLSYGEPKE
jgi:transposase